MSYLDHRPDAKEDLINQCSPSSYIFWNGSRIPPINVFVMTAFFKLLYIPWMQSNIQTVKN